MKIGIITYHNAINFGAVLQTYSTVRSLQKLGASPEVIDYRNKVIESRKQFQLSAVSLRSLPSAFKLITKKLGVGIKSSAFKKFSEDFLNLSDSTFDSIEQLSEIENDYDLFMVSSDQVWNYQINGEDPTYFLQFVKEKAKTASFASSFGLAEIPSELKGFYSLGLNHFASISVREKLGSKLVKEIAGREAIVHADPVFLTPPEDWRDLARRHSKKGVEGALATYFLGPELRVKVDELISGSQLKEKVEVKLAGGLGVKDLISRRVSLRLDRGPIDFVRVLDQSSFVLTGSFHATAFAILLDKPFGVLLKGDPGKDARILELLESFSLLNRVVEKAEDLRFEPPSAGSDTRTVIDDMRSKSLSYLASLIQ